MSQAATKLRRSKIEHTQGRTALEGLEIIMFVEKREDRTTAHFIGQHIKRDDPRPYLRRAIAALEAELADVDNCPAHAA